MNKSIEKLNTKFRHRIVDIAIILEGILAGFIFITHALWPILPMVLIAVFTFFHKAKTKEEKDRQESISNQSFAFGLLIPAFIAMGLFVLLLIKIVPVIIQNWG